MDIQTQKERNPPVRNIKRDSIETQTHTEQFINQAGLKTEKESSIHSLHAEDTAEKKPAAAGAEDMPEETADSEDSGTESGIARKTDSPVTSIDKKRRKAVKKKESDSELDDSPVAEDEENGGSGETRTNNTIPAQADSSTPEDSHEPENRDTIPIILENDSDESDSDNSGEARTNNTIPAQANSSTPEDSHEPENRNAIPIVIDTDSGDSESNNSGEVRTNNIIPVQPDKSEPETDKSETEPEETTPIVDDDDDSDSGEIINNDGLAKHYENLLQYRPDGTITKAGKPNSSAALCMQEKPNQIYYTASNADGYLVCTYVRVLIQPKQRREESN